MNAKLRCAMLHSLISPLIVLVRCGSSLKKSPIPYPCTEYVLTQPFKLRVLVDFGREGPYHDELDNALRLLALLYKYLTSESNAFVCVIAARLCPYRHGGKQF